MSLVSMIAGVAIVIMQAQAAIPDGALSAGAPYFTFRWTDYRGQIAYGDRVPADAQNVLRIDLRYIGEQTQALLPYQLRRAASNFPVMLFTAKNCPPCGSARNFLTQRGIPFAERTIESGDDAMELKRLTKAEGVPVATLGSQVLVAFDPPDWNNLLDATGYPPTSQLPPGFKQEPARPLTAKAPTAPVAVK
jgi:glutaredoxin